MMSRKLRTTWLLVIGGILAACTNASVDLSTNSQSITAKAQTPSVPNYPPMYDIEVKVCGNIIAPVKDGKRCIKDNLRLWGPVEAAKLVRTGIALPSMSAVDHKLAISSKGCYPVYSQPSEPRFYWADMLIYVNKGRTKPTIEINKTQLSNQQIYDLMTSQFSSRRIATFGGVGCEPLPVPVKKK
jgi:hypothetical protein